ncbi:STAS domain-containing protein [Cellulomonas aerilata]|uniref:STAS domain-containing protein n=1 Tax=Cellulomonas aerilata TaxID=515326 RepID=A0A512DG29_9CELL|nr:STAS domain-containing protein [Cellulomonas aerilata]GEO35437.1 hypothetical protein CAE01nite_31620 [Cellulomonas aerilata]
MAHMLSEVPGPHGSAPAESGTSRPAVSRRQGAAPSVPSIASAPLPGRPVVPGLTVARGPAEPRDAIALETRRGRLLVRFSGEIDTALRARFDQVLAVVRAAHEPVAVDCREVTFFGAEGVRMLVLLQRVAGGPGVAEYQPSVSVQRALRLSGIERYPFG